MKTSNINKNSEKFEGLLAKRKTLAKDKKNSICKVSAADSQLNDILVNFNEENLYESRIV